MEISPYVMLLRCTNTSSTLPTHSHLLNTCSSVDFWDFGGGDRIDRADISTLLIRHFEHWPWERDSLESDHIYGAIMLEAVGVESDQSSLFYLCLQSLKSQLDERVSV